MRHYWVKVVPDLIQELQKLPGIDAVSVVQEDGGI